MNEIANEVTIEYDYEEDDCDCAAECSDINVTEEESIWTKQTIHYLLEECLKKKKDLHDPRHRRNKFFGDIREQMIARGFLFSVKTLEKKFHNLKKHFCTICQNRDRATTPGRPITWPYYEKMMEIFAEELEIEDAPTMASLYPDPPPPKNYIVEESKAVTKPEPELETDPEQDTQSDGGEMEVVDEGDDGETESAWAHAAVVAFLRECNKRKYDLWDPQIRRRKIFNEIRQRLKVKGYNFFQESLDRKLRNMKKHFQVVTDAALRHDSANSRRRKITWPYYDQLKEIYGEEMEKEMALRRNGRKSRPSVPQPSQPIFTSTLKFRPIAPKTEGTPNETFTTSQIPQNVQIAIETPVGDQIDTNPPNNLLAMSNGGNEYYGEPPLKFNKFEISPTSPGEFDRSNSQDETSQPPIHDYDSHENPIKCEAETHAGHQPTNIRENMRFSMDVLALEERRTVVVEKMLDEFVESNRIREKRLEFMRIKLEYATARGKRKKNGPF